MKFIFACVIVATIEFVCPAILTKETSVLEDVIAQTVQMVHKRGTITPDVYHAFYMIDMNNDGHITAKELIDMFTRILEIKLTDNEWKDFFGQILGMVDANGNSQLEINEFQVLVEAAKKKIGMKKRNRNTLFDI